MSILVCPVCRGALRREGKSVKCDMGHSFDMAREGYVNLLAGAHKPGNLTGDSREMAANRRDFLDKDYFLPLKKTLGEYIAQNAPAGPGMDICCGEGYYTPALGRRDRYAFDLSKEMVRLAAKRREAECFVANIASIPVRDASVAAAIHLFAPFHDGEFSRVMAGDGLLISVVPGARHLFSMKELLYDKPYENDEAPPEAPSFRLTDRIKVSATIDLTSREDIARLLNMTPYGIHSPASGRARLALRESLETQIEFVLCVLKRG